MNPCFLADILCRPSFHATAAVNSMHMISRSAASARLQRALAMIVFCYWTLKAYHAVFAV